jgi:hypothetical protein
MAFLHLVDDPQAIVADLAIGPSGGIELRLSASAPVEARGSRQSVKPGTRDAASRLAHQLPAAARRPREDWPMFRLFRNLTLIRMVWGLLRRRRRV